MQQDGGGAALLHLRRILVRLILARILVFILVFILARERFRPFVHHLADEILDVFRRGGGVLGNGDRIDAGSLSGGQGALFLIQVHTCLLLSNIAVD